MELPPYALSAALAAAGLFVGFVLWRRHVNSRPVASDPLPSIPKTVPPIAPSKAAAAPAPSRKGDLSGPRFSFLFSLDQARLALLLAGEDAAELAHLLAHLAAAQPELARRALASLSAPRQAETAKALASVNEPDEYRVASLEARLQAAVLLDDGGAA
jgi:hypothetical protein